MGRLSTLGCALKTRRQIHSSVVGESVNYRRRQANSGVMIDRFDRFFVPDDRRVTIMAVGKASHVRLSEESAIRLRDLSDHALQSEP